MKKKDVIRMVLLFSGFTVFVPFSLFMYYGNTSRFMTWYGKGEYTDYPLYIIGTIIVGLAASVAVQTALIFFLPDNRKEKRNRLLFAPISDASCIIHIIIFILSILFTLLLKFGKITIVPIIITDIILLVCELLVIFLPGQKFSTAESDLIERSSESHSLDGFIEYFGKLTEKCESPALSDAIKDVVDILKSIDPSLSHGMQQLETEMSAKCVSIESAISKNDGAKITMLTRELHDTADRLKSKISAAVITLKGNDFSLTDNEIAQGLIDEILDIYEIEEEKDIVSIGMPLLEDLRFIKAKRFAESDYLSLLEAYEASIINENERKIAEIEKKNRKSEKIFTKLTYIGYSIIGLFLISAVLAVALVIQPGGFLYDENDDGTITVVGYNSLYGSDVVVPSEINGKKVTALGEHAIAYDSRVKTVTIPDSVTSLKYESLRNLTNLRSLYIPTSVTYIGNYALAKDLNATLYYAGTREEFLSIEIGNNGNDILYDSTDKSTLSESTIKFESKP